MLEKLQNGGGGKRLVWDRTKQQYVEPHHLPVSRNSGFKFIQLPIEALGRLAVSEMNIPLLVLIRLEELWFQNFKRNPVTLRTFEMCGVQVTRSRKQRALQKLKAAGLVETERVKRRSSVRVTLLWHPILYRKTN
jgi:hypothetical protein